VDENGSLVDVPIELSKRYGRGGKDGGRGKSREESRPKRGHLVSLAERERPLRREDHKSFERSRRCIVG
jgi:hypothetical protein